MGIYRAIDKHTPPNRPKELPTTDKPSERMWMLLLRCWSHDPSARPDATIVLAEVGYFISAEFASFVINLCS